MNILPRFKSLWPDSGLDEPADLEAWRIWFIKAANLIGVIFLPLGMLPSFTLYVAEEKFIVIDITMWIILVIRLFSKPSSYRFDAYVFFAIMYILTTSFFVQLGPSHARPAWLVLCAVMSALMFGRSGAIISTLLNIILLLSVYWLTGDANKAWAAEHSAPFSKWLVTVLNISLLTLMSSLSVSFVLARLDRSLKSVRDTSRKLSVESQKLASVNTALLNEIEQRKQAEKVLRESEERFKLLFENAPDGHFLLDLEGRFLDGNKITEKISGYGKGELAGKTFFEANILSSDQLHKTSTIFKKNAQGLPCGPEELIITRKDGSLINVEINTYPLNNREAGSNSCDSQRYNGTQTCGAREEEA